MPGIYELGPFRLDTEAQVLTHAGAAVPLGARGVAVLSVLVSCAHEHVQKSAILDAAWPGLVVEEACRCRSRPSDGRSRWRRVVRAGSKPWRAAATALSDRSRKLPRGRW